MYYKCITPLSTSVWPLHPSLNAYGQKGGRSCNNVAEGRGINRSMLLLLLLLQLCPCPSIRFGCKCYIILYCIQRAATVSSSWNLPPATGMTRVDNRLNSLTSVESTCDFTLWRACSAGVVKKYIIFCRIRWALYHILHVKSYASGSILKHYR